MSSGISVCSWGGGCRHSFQHFPISHILTSAKREIGVVRQRDFKLQTQRFSSRVNNLPDVCECLVVCCRNDTKMQNVYCYAKDFVSLYARIGSRSGKNGLTIFVWILLRVIWIGLPSVDERMSFIWKQQTHSTRLLLIKLYVWHVLWNFNWSRVIDNYICSRLIDWLLLFLKKFSSQTAASSHIFYIIEQTFSQP